MKKYALIISLVSIALLSACQAKPTDETASENAPVSNVPFTNGPTSAPAVVGPSAPPPDQTEADTQMEAVTTKENIKLTLPAKEQ